MLVKNSDPEPKTPNFILPEDKFSTYRKQQISKDGKQSKVLSSYNFMNQKVTSIA